jgi:hypothetical protein
MVFLGYVMASRLVQNNYNCVDKHSFCREEMFGEQSLWLTGEICQHLLTAVNISSLQIPKIQ